MVDKFNIHDHRGGCDRFGEPCEKGFPAPIALKTEVDGSGSVTYKRRRLDDRSVVPYSRRVFDVWDGHNNVQWASDSICITYLYKYLYKKSDFVRYHISEPEDVSEVKRWTEVAVANLRNPGTP